MRQTSAAVAGTLTPHLLLAPYAHLERLSSLLTLKGDGFLLFRFVGIVAKAKRVHVDDGINGSGNERNDIRGSQSAIRLENEKNLSTGYITYDQRPETYIVPFLFSAIFLIGVVGNGCLIYIFCRHKSMRSFPNLYIFNLAVGDLLVLLCSVPFTETIYTFDSWPYGEFVCKASDFAKDTSVGVSIFTLIALSFERYTVIVKPVKSFVTNSNSKLSIIMCVALIWLASIGLVTGCAVFTLINTARGRDS